MARRTIYDCDHCGAKDVPPLTVSVVVDHERDPADGRNIPTHKSADLCPKCVALAFEVVAHSGSLEWRGKLMDALTTKAAKIPELKYGGC